MLFLADLTFQRVGLAIVALTSVLWVALAAALVLSPLLEPGAPLGEARVSAGG